MSKIHRLRVDLADIRPPIWRRLEVASDTPLDQFHAILQTAMGWMDSHLWAFRGKDGASYLDSQKSLDFADDPDDRLASEATLAEVLPEVGTSMGYEYDFGDGWQHFIQCEAILDGPEDGVFYPRCTAGKRACPPEDCGGPWGYEETCELMKKPKTNRARRERVGWLGGEFDPEAFSAAEVNAALEQEFR